MAVRLKFLTIAFVLLSIAQHGYSQKAKVIARKGDVQVVNGLDVRLASSNMSLSGSETVILGDDAYVGIVDEKGRTIELRISGQHDLSEILKNEEDTRDATAFRFASYLLDRMTAEGKKNRLGAMGYFIRNDEREQEPIRLYIPGAGKFYQDRLELSWEPAPGGGPYTVEFFNVYRELLETHETGENVIEINVDRDLDVQGTFLLKVRTSDGLSSEMYALKRLGSYHREDLTADLQQLEHVYAKSDAVSRFVMAGFFEYQNLLADALTCYLAAMKASPDVPFYMEAYEDFLLRNHLIKL
jgi:hypothetical protein